MGSYRNALQRAIFRFTSSKSAVPLIQTIVPEGHLHHAKSARRAWSHYCFLFSHQRWKKQSNFINLPLAGVLSEDPVAWGRLTRLHQGIWYDCGFYFSFGGPSFRTLIALCGYHGLILNAIRYSKTISWSWSRTWTTWTVLSCSREAHWARTENS